MVEVDNPVTLEQAVEWLRLYLEAEDLSTLAATDEDDLIDQHSELGLLIRNAFSLWDNPALVAATGTQHPDDAALVIIRDLWRRLKPLH